MTLGDMGRSAGMTILFMTYSASVEMLYLLHQMVMETSLYFVSEDVLRVFGTKAYLSTESVKEMISELTEENRIDEEENENVPGSRFNYRRLDWSGRFFNRSG